MLLDVKNLSTTFYLPASTVAAVRSVSFSLKKGESLGIVGESGSGKTVLAHSLLRLIAAPPGKIAGTALFDGTDLVTCTDNELRSIRGNRIAVIFQDPSASFNPYFRLVDQLIEPLMVHKALRRPEAVEVVVKALAATGIQNAQERIRAYPHQFSGGMLQRAMIAMSLAMQPDIVIADEPTTALDVTVQAQLLRLMKTMIVDKGISALFITHNLGIVSGFCNRIIVMYAGRILESAPSYDLFNQPAHPYTRSLINSVPKIGFKGDTLATIPGVPPDPSNPPKGCPFYDRCEYGKKECTMLLPELVTIGENRHTACIRIAAGEALWLR